MTEPSEEASEKRLLAEIERLKEDLANNKSIVDYTMRFLGKDAATEFLTHKDQAEEIERLRVRLDPKVQLDRLETTDLAEQLLFNDMLSHTIDQLSAEVEHLEQQLAKATNQVEGGDAH